jgi:hypothetical protein
MINLDSLSIAMAAAENWPFERPGPLGQEIFAFGHSGREAPSQAQVKKQIAGNQAVFV